MFYPPIRPDIKVAPERSKMMLINEDELYLQNFWQPEPGHTITFGENKTAVIESIVKDFPDQATLKGKKQVVFLQDHYWKPKVDELDKVLTSMGWVVDKETIRQGTLWLKKPGSLPGFAGLLRNCRHMMRMKGMGDPLFKSVHAEPENVEPRIPKISLS